MPGRSESVAAWWFYRPWSLTGRFRDVERYQTLQKCQEQECLGQNKHRQQNALCKTWIRKKPGLFGLKKDRWFFWWSDLWVLFRFNGFHSQLLFLPSRIYWILQSGTYETWNSLSKIVASKLVDLPLWYRWLDGRLYYIYIYIYISWRFSTYVSWTVESLVDKLLKACSYDLITANGICHCCWTAVDHLQLGWSVRRCFGGFFINAWFFKNGWAFFL